MIINGLEITKEDFVGLLKNLKTMKTLNSTDNDRMELDYMLESLISKLESNLVADEQRELRIHDKVEIINTDDEDLNEYIGKVGWIVDIRPLREFPYDVEFEDKNLCNDWLWHKENLKLI